MYSKFGGLIIALLLCANVVRAQQPDPYFDLKVREALAEGLDKSAECQEAVAEFKHRLATEKVLPETSADAAQAFARYRDLTGGTASRVILALKHVSPHATNGELVRGLERMDSVSVALKSGLPLASLATAFPDVTIDSLEVTGVELPAEVDKRILELNAGSVMEPFTSYDGIYVIKLLDKSPLAYDEFASRYNKVAKTQNRLSGSRDAAVESLKTECGFAQNNRNVEDFLRGRAVSGPLFTIGSRDYGYADFLRFSKAYPGSRNTQLEAFIAKSLVDFKDSMLMNTDPGIAAEADGFLKHYLAERIMQEKVVQPSLTDEAGLIAYFTTHRKDYYWPRPKYRHYVILADNKKVGKRVVKLLKKSVKAGRPLVLDDSQSQSCKIEEVVDDYERYAVPSSVSASGYSYASTYDVKVLGPDNYNDVRDRLTADYRDYLERQWIESLRQKYKL